MLLHTTKKETLNVRVTSVALADHSKLLKDWMVIIVEYFLPIDQSGSHHSIKVLKESGQSNAIKDHYLPMLHSLEQQCTWEPSNRTLVLPRTIAPILVEFLPPSNHLHLHDCICHQIKADTKIRLYDKTNIILRFFLGAVLYIPLL